ncbi:flagellar hook-associated 2 domain-containing protein [Thermoanaerobacterium xylanolyticum LX-11]|uniref:Flagellar hook-associated protein 2 n=1 Tax=Thermoanaerobacterium xylanolyticum (strain ATCC 49914 / DSM 7097 / LX-11) TaxID=858215 RepID=F6BJ69_THEXL|nr:flagellar filament capping protein FliD [Thermoanaerobacterium xylanolyticum]AEF17886.1 flagellar hook-associated 2 domain-containing protein [Thermoanaerobacterium xylanolyticum LX-11]
MDPITMQNSTTSNLLRISGLASGINTDQIVSQLMQAASQPLYQLEQQKQWLQWQQEDLQDINTKLLTLRDNTLFSMKLQGTYLAKTVSSNTSIATATAGVNAVNGTYQLNVNQLATGATSASTAAIGAYTNNSDGSVTYNPLISSDVTIRLNNNSITFKAGSTINDIVSTINSVSSTTHVNATYDTTTDRLFLITNSTGSSSKIDFSGTDSTGLTFLTSTLKLGFNSSSYTGTAAYTTYTGSGTSISINGTQINISTNEDINSIISDINNNVSSVNASVDSNGVITISSKNGSQVSISGDYDFLLNNLHLPFSQGTDASFSFNGVNMTTSTNNVSVAGININLTGEGKTTLSVQTDTDTIYNSIKSFVDAYNDVITTINSKLTEQRYYDYQPLTDDQKKQMTQDDITAWQQKARSGDLSGNDNLTSIYYSMRTAISGTVTATDGTQMTLSSIGITTGQWYEGGKLYIDDTKLKNAIQNNPQEVMDLFTKITESTTDVNATPGSSSSDGIAARLYYIVNNGINSITQEAGGGQYQLYDNSFLGQQINDLNQRMSDMQDQLNTLEQQYYDQFTQLETYMSQMNSQSQWLSQQLNG